MNERTNKKKIIQCVTHLSLAQDEKEEAAAEVVMHQHWHCVSNLPAKNMFQSSAKLNLSQAKPNQSKTNKYTLTHTHDQFIQLHVVFHTIIMLMMAKI